jgi:NAD(P)-dependent dehydrogenase (short-subunit alcohol dehydrogenase family)
MKIEAGMAAVVTGGASGLGKASAKAFADAGMKVAIFDINDADGEAHAAAIGGSFHHVDIMHEI